MSLIMDHKTLPLLIALSFLFSGCLGLFEDDPETDGDSDAADDPSDTEPADPDAGNDDNQTTEPPEVSLTASVTQGIAPIDVEFELDAEHTDKEGLTWTLDIDDGSDPETGEGLPAVVEHTYDAAGNFTVTLNVTYENASGEAELVIEVQEEDHPDPVLIEGSAIIGHPAHLVRCFHGGIDGDIHTIAPAAPGWTYSVEPADSVVVYWWGEEEFLEDGESQGTVPAEAAQAELCMTEGTVEGEYTMTLWAPGHPEAP